MNEDVIRDLDVFQIQKYQQNRYPCLFVDYVEEAVPGKSAKGYKNWSFNEWFFPNHFPDEPNVPGFIQIECLTQMFLMTFLTIPENKGKKTSFVAVNNAHFKKKIIPGMRMDIEAVCKSFRRGLAVGSAKGYIGGELACEAEFTVVIPDVMNQFNPAKSKVL